MVKTRDSQSNILQCCTCTWAWIVSVNSLVGAFCLRKIVIISFLIAPTSWEFGICRLIVLGSGSAGLRFYSPPEEWCSDNTAGLSMDNLWSIYYSCWHIWKGHNHWEISLCSSLAKWLRLWNEGRSSGTLGATDPNLVKAQPTFSIVIKASFDS
jgi:hypothetical protein